MKATDALCALALTFSGLYEIFVEKNLIIGIAAIVLCVLILKEHEIEDFVK